MNPPETTEDTGVIKKGNRWPSRILWLAFATTPSIVALQWMSRYKGIGPIPIYLIVIDAVVSLISGVMILRGTKDRSNYIVTAGALSITFFILNAVFTILQESSMDFQP